MDNIQRYAMYYYSLVGQSGPEGSNVQNMDKHYLVNAFKKMLKIEEHKNNTKWLQHNLTELEIEIIRRLS